MICWSIWKGEPAIASSVSWHVTAAVSPPSGGSCTVSRPTGELHRLVEVSERYAEGEATWEEVLVAAEFAPQGRASGGSWRSKNPVHLPPSSQAQRAALSLAIENAWDAAWGVVREGANLLGSVPCDLMRDLLGIHFALWSSTHLGCRGKEVLFAGLAQAIYDDRQRHYDSMPILSDALEGGGLHVTLDILTHCREPGEHVRGCWVVDALLGRETAIQQHRGCINDELQSLLSPNVHRCLIWGESRNVNPKSHPDQSPSRPVPTSHLPPPRLLG